MGEENQTILEKDLSNSKKRKTLFFIIEKMQAMRRKGLYPTL